MSLKIVTISDGFESAAVPAIGLPTVERVQTYHYALTAPDILAGFVTLPATMIFPGEAVLLWEGINQTYGEDYTAAGNQVFFLGSFLATLIPGDSITIIFS